MAGLYKRTITRLKFVIRTGEKHMSNNTDETKAVHKHQEDQSHSCSSDCGCHNHSSDSEPCCAHPQEPLVLSSGEKSVLLELMKFNYLPVSRFIMSSSQEAEARFISLAPVYLKALDDSLETVKAIGAILSGLAQKRLISLDYDIPGLRYPSTGL